MDTETLARDVRIYVFRQACDRCCRHCRSYGSRKFGTHLPLFLAEYAGDTLWALMVYIGTGFLFPEMPPIRIATIALSFSFLIEISQLYHAPWIDDIRHTTLGGLVLGYGFLWSDLVCYACGVMIGLVSETLWRAYEVKPAG